MTTGKLVLVTGASGYLGAHCIKRLLEQGYQVRGTVRNVNNATKVDPIKILDPNGKQLTLVEADLGESAGWSSAVSGCDYVLHVASPCGFFTTDEVIQTAIDGTRNVLEACANEPSIKKVVLTSSMLAIFEGHPSGKLTNKDWSILDNAAPYPKSKTLAEQWAWEFVKEGGRKNNFILTVINPGLIFGPPLTPEKSSSAEIVSRMMGMPALPHVNFTIVDVRDVATAKVAALSAPETDGQRVICTNAEPAPMVELSKALREEFGSQGYCPPTRNIPDWLVRFGSNFSQQMAEIASRLGVVHTFDNSMLIKLLGRAPIRPEDSIVEMTYELIERGHIKKTTKYRGRAN
ncbi:unnamed protein product, partial [Mesorhabditis spiculigera]